MFNLAPVFFASVCDFQFLNCLDYLQLKLFSTERLLFLESNPPGNGVWVFIALLEANILLTILYTYLWHTQFLYCLWVFNKSHMKCSPPLFPERNYRFHVVSLFLMFQVFFFCHFFFCFKTLPLANSFRVWHWQNS